MPGHTQRVHDFVLVGGGLSAALALLALRWQRPEATVALIEREPGLGGNHTWCFHGGDVGPESAPWLEPLVVARWPGYTVRFPGRRRRLGSPYACVTSDSLERVVRERCAGAAEVTFHLGRSACEIGASHVLLDDGTRVLGKLVVDARGPELAAVARDAGFQKFVGLELSVEPGHGLSEPILIDATLPQRDGLRFMYVLPFDDRRVLVEDTYISQSEQLDDAALDREIMAYAERLGLRVRCVLRRERGILPMPGRGRAPSAVQSPIVAGYRGGYFHPVTGYSFPLAVRFAEALSRTDPERLIRSPVLQLARQHGQQLGFLFALTRIMFRWFAPQRRFSVLEHFYRLPEGLIARFYAAQLSGLDRVRIFWGPLPRGLDWQRVLGIHAGEQHELSRQT